MDERGYCASVERGAGSGDFESGKQELLSEFYKYRISTKNRNFDSWFFQNFYFWWKSGPITVDSEDPSTLLNGRYSITFFALKSYTAFNSRKGVLAVISISARTWCPRPLWAPSFTSVVWYSRTTFPLVRYKSNYKKMQCGLNRIKDARKW
jgi:hypothetical protein